jgi:hypothetical protein
VRAGVFAWIAWFSLCILAAPGAASDASPPGVPEFTGLVVDETGALTQDEIFPGRTTGRASGMRWSYALFGLAALVALPFALLAFYLAIGGEDIRTQLTQAAAAGGTIAALIALAGRLGLIAAVKNGLGGRFGGGAGRG